MIERPTMPAPPEYVAPADPEDIPTAKAAHEAALAQHRADWKAAIQQWEADRYAAEGKLPRHALAGAWLRANPTPGVEATDRGDGLGPRLLGWAGDHPDIDSWAATYVAPPTREEVRAAKLAALEVAKDSLDKASTVAGVRSAAAAAIAALEARVAALEGK